MQRYKRYEAVMDRIEYELLSISKYRTGIDFDQNKELRVEGFMGKKLGIPPREIMLLCLDVEKVFNLKISDLDIENEYCNTFDALLALIREKKRSSIV